MRELFLTEAGAARLVALLKARGIKGETRKMEANQVRVRIHATKEQAAEAVEIIKYIRTIETK